MYRLLVCIVVGVVAIWNELLILLFLRCEVGAVGDTPVLESFFVAASLCLSWFIKTRSN